MARTLNLKALSEALGLDKGQLSRESNRPGFPFDKVSGVRLFDAEEVRAWRVANVKPSRRRGTGQSLQVQAADASPIAASSPAGSGEIPSPPELSAHEKELMRVLEDPQASEVSRAEAGFAIAGIAAAAAYRRGEMGVQHLENLKKQGEELRKAKADYIDLAERRGELIERDVAQELAGDLALRLVTILSNVENALATRFEIWMADPAFQALPTEQRQQQIRSWFEDQARTLRELEAAEIDALIESKLRERADQKGVA